MEVVELAREAAAGSLAPAAGRPLLVMLSGGRDSVCLLDVALALHGPQRLGALHVNYGLREEAAADERHCVDLCESLGVELTVVRASRAPRRGTERSGGSGGEGRQGGDGRDGRDGRDGQEGSEAAGGPGNLQAWAREVRYREAGRIAERHDGLFASGHTASDQVETILYRLACSPGRRALLGMSRGEGRMIRPLLSLTREQTAAYCEARSLAWREDASNDDERFARARVRHGLLAALRSVHPAADANVLRTARLLREETELLDGLVAEELAGRSSIEIARLRELPAALARLIVVRLAEQAVGDYVPQAGDRVEEILALDRGGARAELHVGANAGAVVEGGLLRMVRLPPRGD